MGEVGDEKHAALVGFGQVVARDDFNDGGGGDLDRLAGEGNGGGGVHSAQMKRFGGCDAGGVCGDEGEDETVIGRSIAREGSPQDKVLGDAPAGGPGGRAIKGVAVGGWGATHHGGTRAANLGEGDSGHGSAGGERREPLGA